MDKSYLPGGFSNEAILQQLRHGIANFEIASSPVPSVSSQCFRRPLPLAPSANATPRFFARIGPSLGAGSPAMKKVERYSVQKVNGDGRCLFRALVLSKLCCQPIVVYIPEHEHGGWGTGFIPIQEYGSEFRKGSKKGKPREVVRLLYTGKNHYDLLV
ncbi:UNVERIFIED_CONTAM: OVARIAN TUMOR DOMAIN-containing deubiquitinating enzyme 3 [Sesamum angustifolium]|uniref:Ubiquitin thioesterase OTU n=1 Tax=Sesamum angustifolium TaxID=2727405 RepID=A0AAW2MPB3_9LAMI